MLEELVKGPLILNWICPVGKVADVASLFEGRSPSFLALQHGSINTNGVENDTLLVNLPINGLIDLVADPFTVHRMLREDDDNTIMHMDRLVNLLAKEVSWLQIMRSKPATDASGLQIRVQSLGE